MPLESGGWTYPRAACGSLKFFTQAPVFAHVYTTLTMHASGIFATLLCRLVLITFPIERRRSSWGYVRKPLKVRNLVVARPAIAVWSVTLLKSSAPV